MPFYEYQCNCCGHTLEAMQKVHDAPLKKCPECGKPQLKRLMSAPVFRLKGGGWYETDFKSDQDAKRNLADRPEAAAKDETKAAAEAPAKDAAAPDTAKVADKAADKAAEKAPAAASAAAAPAAKTAPKRPKPKAAAKRPTRLGAKRAVAKPARRR